MNAPSLYHITGDVFALEALVSEAIEAGADGDAVNAIIAGWFDELDGDFADKLARVARWRATELSLADAGKAEAKRLTDRAKAREARVERLDAAIEALMKRLGRTKVDTDIATFAIQKPGGKDPVVVDDSVDLATLPLDCVKETLSPIKEAIRTRLEAGEVLPGCHIQKRGLVLRVK